MSSRFTRREVLGLALVSPLVAAVPALSRAQSKLRQGENPSVVTAPGRVVAANGAVSARQVQLRRRWRGPVCFSQLVNHGRVAVPIKEVVLFDIPLNLPPAPGLQ